MEDIQMEIIVSILQAHDFENLALMAHIWAADNRELSLHEVQSNKAIDRTKCSPLNFFLLVYELANIQKLQMSEKRSRGVPIISINWSDFKKADSSSFPIQSTAISFSRSL